MSTKASVGYTPKEFLERRRESKIHPSDQCTICGGRIEEHPEDERHHYDSRKKVRVVKVPVGEAPIEIRRQWPGVEFKARFEHVTTDASGVISGTSQPQTCSWLVFQKDAIEALEEAGRHSAAQWWRNTGLPKEGQCFAFKADEIQEVK